MNEIREKLITKLNHLSKDKMKLTGFMCTHEYRNLTNGQKILLRKQCSIMQEYDDILSLRIELLGG